MTPLRCERILVTLGLCTAIGACDTFAESPPRDSEGDPPLPAVRPVPPTPTATAVFSPPTPVTTFVPTAPPVPPQSTATTPTPTITVPRSLPICPPPPTHAQDTTSAASSSTAADHSNEGFPIVDGGLSPSAIDADGGHTLDLTSAFADVSSPSTAGDASPALLPSGDTVLVDDLTLLIIFDNSGSMAECWDGQTRWEHANHALRAAIEPAQHSLQVGAIRFPADEECLVEPFDSPNQFAFGLGHAFLAEWDAHARYPVGGTPLAAAMIAADKAIQDAEVAGLLEERFRVVILTDGEPNCDGSPSLLTTLPVAWRTLGVETHVLGLPGSDGASALLQEIADAGGGVYEQLTTPGELHDSAERAAR